MLLAQLKSMDPKQIPEEFELNQGAAAVIEVQNQYPEVNIPNMSAMPQNVEYSQYPVNTHQPMMYVLEPVPPIDHPAFYSQPPQHPNGYNPGGPAYQPYGQPV